MKSANFSNLLKQAELKSCRAKSPSSAFVGKRLQAGNQSLRVCGWFVRLVGVASTLVLGLGLAPASGSAQKPLPVSVEESRQLLQRGRVAEARAKLEAFLSQRPDSVEASTLLAQAYLLEDNYESATPLVLKGLKTHPMNSQLLATYGQCLFRQGDLLQAETQFRKSLTLNPKQASAHLGMGRILLSRLKSTEALQSLEQAMQFAPDLEDPYFFASEAYGNTHNLKGQVQSLEKYISFDSLTHPERVQNAKALLQFFRSLEKETVSGIKDQSRNYVFEVQPFFGLMLIEVRVNGEGPFRFLVDTGATSTVISNTLLSQLKITPIATSITRCVGGEGRIGSQLCKLSSLDIGDLRINNVPVSSFDNAIFAELIDGVLSTSTLSDFLITLDYSDHRILLNPRPSSTVSPPTETKAVPKLQGEFRIFGNLLLVAVSVNHQTSKKFLFDTGAVTSALSKKQAGLLGVSEDTPDSRVDIQFAGACGVTKSVLSVNRVDLSSLGRSVKYAQILAVDLQEISKELETEVCGILGGDFFSRYKVTLDYYNTTIKLEE